jgi:hypothetical protein
MPESENTRREFLKASSVALAATASGSRSQAAPATDQKILNYNPKMGYRRLGKTGFMISEIALGGHGATKEDRVRNRTVVLERAVELGMNYVDNNIVEECDLYGKAMATSGSAGRDKWFIGFASWPQKLTEEYEAEIAPEKMMRSIEDRLRSYQTDVLDMWRPVGATWGEGQRNIATLLMVTPRALDMAVGVFEKAKKQGKVRFLGISAHNPKVFRRVLEEYPQFHVIIFPYLFLTTELGGDSLLKLAEAKGVGVIGLKPFGAGATFNIKPREIAGRVDPRAHVLLAEMLRERRVSAVIPGVNYPEQLDENIRASYEKASARSEEDERALASCRENFYANLTPGYQWLRQWEKV